MPVPQLPSLPGGGSMPGVPGLGALQSLPGANALGSLPQVPSPGDLPAAAGGVPMQEITFPQPASDATTASATPAASPAGGGGGGGGGAGGANADGHELDELAHKLYDRIRWRLRSELRLDMERSGLGAGVRR
jgi:hypothetical protein